MGWQAASSLSQDMVHLMRSPRSASHAADHGAMAGRAVHERTLASDCDFEWLEDKGKRRRRSVGWRFEVAAGAARAQPEPTAAAAATGHSGSEF